MPEKIVFSTTANLYKNENLLPDNGKMLIEKAREACKGAYSPYSNFCVGAALILEDGEVVTGANQENAAYPSGLCAERSAIYWAGANHKGKKIKAIAVTAHRAGEDKFLPVSPCGSCRQAMLEYEHIQEGDIEVLLESDGGVLVFPSVASLLPLQFDKKSL